MALLGPTGNPGLVFKKENLASGFRGPRLWFKRKPLASATFSGLASPAALGFVVKFLHVVAFSDLKSNPASGRVVF